VEPEAIMAARALWPSHGPMNEDERKRLQHDPQKVCSGFTKRSCANKNLERDDGSS
jgi:hypothetical protein